MVENLRIVSGNVNWIFNSIDINLEIKDAFFASEIEELQLIKIDSGKNFIENKVFYYNPNGDLELCYDLEVGIIEWFFQGDKKRLNIKNMKQVGFFPQKQRIFVLCNCKQQELQGYAIDGSSLFKVNNPPKFQMRYFVKTKDGIAVACDGDKDQEDEYGRFRYNFLIDINNGTLTKGSIAY